MAYHQATHSTPSILCGFNGCNTVFAGDIGHDSYLQHLLAVHVGLPLFLLSPSSITCRIDACTSTLPAEQDYTQLAHHLVYRHGYLLCDGNSDIDFETTCRWKNCGAKPTPPPVLNTSSPSEHVQPISAAQAWQGRSSDFLDHILSSHLGFAELCSICGSGPFSRKSSKQRHEAACKGQVPARCKVCLREFPSIIALGGHAHLGMCWSTS